MTSKSPNVWRIEVYEIVNGKATLLHSPVMMNETDFVDWIVELGGLGWSIETFADPDFVRLEKGRLRYLCSRTTL